MAEENTVNVTDVKGSNSADVSISADEAKAASAAENQGPSPDSLGVSQEQFDKYFDKDKGAYDWQSHAKEAEFKLTQKGETAGDGAKKGVDKAELKTDGADEAGAREAAEKAGLDWDALGKKVVDAGDIEDADYEALEKIGIPKNVANDYVQSLHERAAQHVKDVHAEFGGEDNFKKVAEAVADKFTDEEKAAINKRLSDPREFKMTAKMLLAEAGMPPPEKGRTLSGTNAAAPSSAAGAEPYKSQAEMVADQRKPEYKTDPAFREKVYARAAKSDFDTNPRAHAGGL